MYVIILFMIIIIWCNAFFKIDYMQAAVAVVSWLRESFSPVSVPTEMNGIVETKGKKKKKRAPPTCSACRKHENVRVLRKGHVCPYKEDTNSPILEKTELNSAVDKTIPIQDDESSDNSLSPVLGKRNRRHPSEEEYVPSDSGSEDEYEDEIGPPVKKKPKSQVVVIHPTNQNQENSPTVSESSKLEGEIIRIPKERIRLDQEVLGSGAFGHVKKANVCL